MSTLETTGCDKKRYKNEFARFRTIAYASFMESQLNMINEIDFNKEINELTAIKFLRKDL
ncbi:MAG: hypothetical protein JEZ03_10585 [Bacteroidales bacterium]|nr:hypothetical protein [Bacteroidales bacterium]